MDPAPGAQPRRSHDSESDRVNEDVTVTRRVIRSDSTSTRRSTQFRLPFSILRPSTWTDPPEIVRRTIITSSPSRGSRSSRGSLPSRGSESTGVGSPKRVSWSSDIQGVISPASGSQPSPRSIERTTTTYERRVPPPTPSPPPFRRRGSSPPVEIVRPAPVLRSARAGDEDSVEYITVEPARGPRARSVSPPPRSARREADNERRLRMNAEVDAEIERQRRIRAETVAHNAQRTALNEHARRLEADDDVSELAAQTAAATIANTRTEEENARLRDQMNRERNVTEREQNLDARIRRQAASTRATAGVARTSPPRLDPSPQIIQRRDGPLERRGAEVLAREVRNAAERRRREQEDADADAQARRDRRHREQIVYSDEDRRRWAGRWE